MSEWIAENNAVKGYLMASSTPPQAFPPPSSSSSTLPAKTTCLYCAIAASSSVNHRRPVLLGKLGMNQKAVTATKTLTIPSRRINHCHARRSAMPFMFVRIAAASKLEKTLEIMFPACQIPIRNGDSFLVYQEEVRSETAGMKGPSAKPTRNRQRQNAQPDDRAGIQIVTADQTSMMDGKRILGFPLAIRTFAGTCEMM